MRALNYSNIPTDSDYKNVLIVANNSIASYDIIYSKTSNNNDLLYEYKTKNFISKTSKYRSISLN